MEIKVLGTGCAKCTKLEDLTKEVLGELGVQADVIKVSDVKEIAKLGVLMTPGLVVNGQVKVSGKLPSKGDLTSIITSELAKE
ncbi:small redox-active disulfide protein 2 [Desulfitispora alkaliphila]|uniref:thioredoxin family protein n=1 Tax=Desulfitispora alkaliphila TaxID=622674 RepID=UPI003D25C2BE